MSVERLIIKWRPVLFETRHIWSWSGDGELSYWAEQASQAKKIIEVGTHYGRSAKVMLTASPLAKLWCIDPFLQDGTKHTAEHFLRTEIESGRCQVLPLYTPEASGLLEPERGEIDLIMIDGGHEKDQVERDCNALYPLLRQGGLICGHDLDQNPDNGVTQAVKGLFPNFAEPVSRVWAHYKS